jgi:hypothetical protein
VTPSERAALIRECGRHLRPPFPGSKVKERVEKAAWAAEYGIATATLRSARAAVDDSLHAIEGFGSLADRRALWAVLALLDGEDEQALRWMAEMREARGAHEEPGR